MPQRRAKQRRTGQSRRDTGHHLNVHVREFLSHLQQQPGHTVYSRVAAAHQCHSFALRRRCQRPAAALNFLAHPGGIGFFAGKLRRSQRHIGRIAAQNVRRFQGCAGLQRQVNAVAGTEAHNIYLMSHRIAISNLAPRAPQPVPSSHRQWFPCGAEVFLRCAAPHCARIHCPLPPCVPQRPKQ